MCDKSKYGYTIYGGWTFCEFVDFRIFICVYIYIYIFVFLGGSLILDIVRYVVVYKSICMYIKVHEGI